MYVSCGSEAEALEEGCFELPLSVLGPGCETYVCSSCVLGSSSSSSTGGSNKAARSFCGRGGVTMPAVKSSDSGSRGGVRVARPRPICGRFEGVFMTPNERRARLWWISVGSSGRGTACCVRRFIGDVTLVGGSGAGREKSGEPAGESTGVGTLVSSCGALVGGSLRSVSFCVPS
jgi:hypothetical protein